MTSFNIDSSCSPSTHFAKGSICHARDIYLDHASKSLLPPAAKEAALHFFEERNSGGSDHIEIMLDDLRVCKDLFARIIHASEASRVGWTESTSTALNLVVDALPWQPGDEVIVFAKDFPANVFPFLKLRTRFGVNVRVVADTGYLYQTEDYLRLITDRTRLLTVSFVNFLTGQVADLTRLGQACRERGVTFVVDGIQGVGAVPIDVEAAGVDFLAVGGYKWLCCPQGTGFFYFSERLQAKIVSPSDGWLDRVEPFKVFNWLRPKCRDSWQFQVGTWNELGAALCVAILRFRQSIDEDQISERVLLLSNVLKRALMDRSYELLSHPEFASGIVSFRCTDAERIAMKLAQAKIFVSEREGFLRVSPHFCNTELDLELFLTNLEKATGEN